MPKRRLAHNAEYSPATAKRFDPFNASSQCCCIHIRIAPCIAVSCQCDIPILVPEADDYSGDVIAAVSGFHDLPLVVCLSDQLRGTSLLSGDLKLAMLIALILPLNS